MKLFWQNRFGKTPLRPTDKKQEGKSKWATIRNFQTQCGCPTEKFLNTQLLPTLLFSWANSCNGIATKKRKKNCILLSWLLCFITNWFTYIRLTTETDEFQGC